MSKAAKVTDEKVANQTTIAIVGYGLSGRGLVERLLARKAAGKLGDYSITVIEPNNFYESYITMPNAIRYDETHYENNASCPAYQLQLNGVQYVRKKVSKVSKNGDLFTLDLDNGSESITAAFVVA